MVKNDRNSSLYHLQKIALTFTRKFKEIRFLKNMTFSQTSDRWIFLWLRAKNKSCHHIKELDVTVRLCYKLADEMKL